MAACPGSRAKVESEEGYTKVVFCGECGQVVYVEANGLTELHEMPAPPVKRPRAFVLERDEDVTGVSGTGVVAEGVEFSDGVVALRWISKWPTSVVFHEKGIESVETVHGHDGKTRIVWR